MFISVVITMQCASNNVGLNVSVDCSSENHTYNQKIGYAFPAVTTSLREHASRKGSPSSLSRGGKEETQEKAPGAEPQFLLYGCEVPRML